MLKNITPAVLLILSFACLSDQRIERIDHIFSELHQENKFNGMILIAERGRTIYEKSFGFADYDKKALFKPDSMTNIASVSKVFTAVAIMMLVERKQLQLEEDVRTYLPHFPYDNISIKNLLTHTSGLYEEQKALIRNAINGKGVTNQELLEIYTQVKPEPNFAPGHDYSYSNTNYTLLALILEKVSQQKLPEFLHKNIFKPLKMKHSYLTQQNVPEALKKNIVSYYRKPQWLSNQFKNIQTLESNILEAQTFNNKYGGSQIYTTARDLLKFHQGLQNGQLLQEATLQLMYQPMRLKNDKSYTVNATSNYPALSALGWRIAKDQSAGRIVFHAGGFRGGRSFFIRNLDKDQVIILLTNNTETNRHTFTFPMRALNQQKYVLDKKSLARAFSKMYISDGIEAAVMHFQQHKNNPDYILFVDWDYEEIGAELINKKDHKGALALFKLYRDHMPENGYAWSLLGQAYLLNGNKTKAKASYLMAEKLLPEDEEIKQAMQQLQEK